MIQEYYRDEDSMATHRRWHGDGTDPTENRKSRSSSFYTYHKADNMIMCVLASSALEEPDSLENESNDRAGE
jgi:hypothetical protein